MDRNAYFIVNNEYNGTYLKVVDAINRGAPLNIEDVMYYLDTKHIEYDVQRLNSYIFEGNYNMQLKLNNKRGLRQNEHLKLEIDRYGMRVVGKFFAPTNDGSEMTLEDIIEEMKRNNIVSGYILKNIQIHVKARLYCTDILIAKAIKPIHGHDASIEYFFDTQAVAKPKLNEDGTVDFHQLGNISHVAKGERLAHLTPVDFGKPGKDVFGRVIPAKKVARKVLKHGRNITLSEDKLDMYSDVSGHATLIEGTVYVSDVYEVPNNIDASTGDINYNGNVTIKGNVNTGYAVRATGDVVVEGIVEGATIVAGGDITLRRGVQGMFRAKLTAKGDIVSRFIENCELVKADGTISTDAIMHSEVCARGEVIVKGKRGLISGGKVISSTSIFAKTVGSAMDTPTLLEVGIDPDRMERYRYLEQEIEDRSKDVDEFMKLFESFQRKVKAGVKMDNDKLKKIQDAKIIYAENNAFIKDAKQELEKILAEIDSAKSGQIAITGVTHSGVTVVISRAKLRVNDDISYTKFVKDGVDIRMMPI
ncbi:MAG: DUF342 domain-containing protein [Lachnospiraceae bacterium]|nr:DUF342 domain-containing protein [Lachnospiraceae bacterium]